MDLVGKTFRLRNDNVMAKRWREEFAMSNTSTLVVLVTEIFHSHRTYASIVIIDDNSEFGFGTNAITLEEMGEKYLWEML